MTEMVLGSGVFSRPAARFVAIGLFLMAFFTTMWALWSLYGLPVIVASALIVIFVGFLSDLRGQWCPADQVHPAAPRTDRRRVETARPSATGGIRCHVRRGGRDHCARLRVARIYGANAYFGPAIALVVGLHFIPLGFIFHRTVDFYIAGWVVVWAIVGIWLITSQIISRPLAASLVAVATACGTAAYGVYLLRVKRSIIAALAEAKSGPPRDG